MAICPRRRANSKPLNFSSARSPRFSNAPSGVDLGKHGLRMPIAADIAARHGRKDEAIALLQKWHGLAANNLKKAKDIGFGEGISGWPTFPRW